MKHRIDLPLVNHRLQNNVATRVLEIASLGAGARGSALNISAYLYGQAIPTIEIDGRFIFYKGDVKAMAKRQHFAVCIELSSPLPASRRWRFLVSLLRMV